MMGPMDCVGNPPQPNPPLPEEGAKRLGNLKMFLNQMHPARLERLEVVMDDFNVADINLPAFAQAHEQIHVFAGKVKSISIIEADALINVFAMQIKFAA